MTTRAISMLLLTSGLLALLAACNDNDHDTPSTQNLSSIKTLTVVPSLGKINNGHVVLRNAVSGQLLGEGNTGLLGSVDFNVPATVDFVVAEVYGSDSINDCNMPNSRAVCYFDEATQSFQQMKATDVIRVAAPVARRVGVTFLTEAAVRYAEQQADHTANQGLPINIIKASNQTVASIFGINSANLVSPPTLVNSSEGLVNLLITAQTTFTSNSYALLLTALVKNASNTLGVEGMDRPALQLTQVLANDLSDGVLDNQSAGKTQLVHLYQTDADLLKINLRNALHQVANTLKENNFLLPTDISQTIDKTPISLAIPPTTLGMTSAVVHPELQHSYELVYTSVVSTTSPLFMDGEQLSANIAADGSLLIKSNRLNNPFYRTRRGNTVDSTVINWQDKAHHLEFGLSNNNNGKFNAFDVYDSTNIQSNGMPRLLGKLISSKLDCGSLPTLSLSELMPFAKTYHVDITSNIDSTIQTNIPMTLTTQGDIIMSGITVHSDIVCKNIIDGKSRGVITYFTDSNQQLGHMNFYDPVFNGITVSGTNFTDKEGANSFIRNTEQNGQTANVGKVVINGSINGEINGLVTRKVTDSNIPNRAEFTMQSASFGGDYITAVIQDNKLLHVTIRKDANLWQTNCDIASSDCSQAILNNDHSKVIFSNLILKDLNGGVIKIIGSMPLEPI